MQELPRHEAATRDRRRRLRFRRALGVSLGLGLFMSVLAPVMRDAWPQGPAVAVGSGIVATLGTWLLIRYGFEPLYRKVEAREGALQRQADRQEFGAQLNRALERSRTEHEALKITMRAVQAIVPDLPAEALIADSSRAHLRRQISTDDLLAGPAAAGEPAAGASVVTAAEHGCKVISPWDCPAMSSSQPHHFADSRALDSCPFLTERAQLAGAPLTATCLPLTSRGQAIGVLHTVRAASEPVDSETQTLLGTVATRAGATIGATRAFAKSQLQASTDPLTGLLNRRSFEARALAVLESVGRYGLIMADLDHFKMLNDVHGHSTGDRALRRFASVVRSVARAEDVIARVGGEEFIILLPLAGVTEAVALAERLRTQLGVRVGETEPTFTVSLGVAEGSHAEDLHGVIAAADQALFAAKAAGRDRIVIANGATISPPLPRVG